MKVKTMLMHGGGGGGGGGGGAVDRGYYGGERVANAIDFLCLSRQYKE